MDKNQNSGEVNEAASSQDSGKKLPSKKAIIIGVSSVITVILLAVIGISVHINKTVSAYDT